MINMKINKKIHNIAHGFRTNFQQLKSVIYFLFSILIST